MNMKLEIQQKTKYLLPLRLKRTRVEEEAFRNQIIEEVNSCSTKYEEYLRKVSQLTGVQWVRRDSRFRYFCNGREISSREYEKVYLSTFLHN